MCTSKSSTEKPRRRKYRNVRLPIGLYDEISKEAEERGVAIWKVIADAFSRYKLVRKKPEERMKLPRLDKASWYVFKLCNSVGAFKENPSSENYERLMATLSQIEIRTKVSCEMVRKAVDEYLKYRDSYHKMELNDIVKMTVGDIVAKYLFAE